MSFWSRLLGRSTPAPNPALLVRLQTLPKPAPLDQYRLDRDRFVVIDLETTGLDVRRDDILSVGAVAIEAGRIALGDQFERTVRRSGKRTLTNVLIHGLSPSTLSRGEPLDTVLLDLLEYVGTSPLLAFHAPFDEAMLKRALRRTLNYRLEHPFTDVAPIASALCRERAPKHNSLDLWLQEFGLGVSSRHNAAADALATAELFLILLRFARNQGIHYLSDLLDKTGLQQRLQAMRP